MREPIEADAVKFYLALTVCAMRYISDLHIGKAAGRDDNAGVRDCRSIRCDRHRVNARRLILAM